MATRSMEHSCSCCSELEVGKMTVEMICANGARIAYTYTNVIRCGCVSAFCTPNSPSVASGSFSGNRRKSIRGSYSNEV